MNADTFENPAAPAGELLSVNPFRLMGLTTAQQSLIAGGAVGAIIVMPFSHDIVAGLYTFGVPEIHQMPTCILDREAGASVIHAATAGKQATLRLAATTEQADTYQSFCYLPGKDYGTPNDLQVLLVNAHRRPFDITGKWRTRHPVDDSLLRARAAGGAAPHADGISRLRYYMPGAERAFAEQDYAVADPDLYKRVIASMGIEHLGQIPCGGEKGPAVPARPIRPNCHRSVGHQQPEAD